MLDIQDGRSNQLGTNINCKTFIIHYIIITIIIKNHSDSLRFGLENLRTALLFRLEEAIYGLGFEIGGMD